MRYFADELERQLESSGHSQAALAEQAGISQSQIWKWLSSAQTSISGDQIDALASALRSSPTDHARLLVAHLQDERAGKSADLVTIDLILPAELRDQPAPRSRGERAVHFLAQQRLQNRDVNELVIDLARCLGADL